MRARDYVQDAARPLMTLMSSMCEIDCVAGETRTAIRSRISGRSARGEWIPLPYRGPTSCKRYD